MYISNMRNKKTSMLNHFNQRKGPNMKAYKMGAVQYKSRSAAAVVLAKMSKMSNSEIARKVGMTPQTVKQAVDRAVGRE